MKKRAKDTYRLAKGVHVYLGHSQDLEKEISIGSLSVNCMHPPLEVWGHVSHVNCIHLGVWGHVMIHVFSSSK